MFLTPGQQVLEKGHARERGKEVKARLAPNGIWEIEAMQKTLAVDILLKEIEQALGG